MPNKEREHAGHALAAGVIPYMRQANIKPLNYDAEYFLVQNILYKG